MSVKVSVITPVLNGITTIADCISSVKQQDYDNIEHIIIDASSTDGTVEYIASQKVKYISEADTGVYDAFNKGIKLATGDIIHILNADDYYANDRVVSTVVAKLEFESTDLCHGYITQMNRQGEPVKRVGKSLDKHELLSKMRVAHPSVFIRKNVYLKYGYFSQGFKVAGDHEFLLRIWDLVDISFLDEICVNMRLGGISNSQVELSYRESMAAAIMHGAAPWKAMCRYYLELVKSKLF
jgi:glycosyltransferase involved in cell wall biosynthesis